MVDVDEIDLKFTDLQGIPGPDQLLFLAGYPGPEVFQLDLDQLHGHGCGIDGYIKLFEKPGQGPDMVFMAMGNQDAPDFIAMFPQIGEVGDDDINSRHPFIGEGHAAVDDEDVVAVLEDGHVLADLPHSAQGDHFKHFFLGLEGFFWFSCLFNSACFFRFFLLIHFYSYDKRAILIIAA